MDWSHPVEAFLCCHQANCDQESSTEMKERLSTNTLPAEIKSIGKSLYQLEMDAQDRSL